MEALGVTGNQPLRHPVALVRWCLAEASVPDQPVCQAGPWAKGLMLRDEGCSASCLPRKEGSAMFRSRVPCETVSTQEAHHCQGALVHVQRGAASRAGGHPRAPWGAARHAAVGALWTPALLPPPRIRMITPDKGELVFVEGPQTALLQIPTTQPPRETD